MEYQAAANGKRRAISAETIAKRRYYPQDERDVDAAAWVLRELDVEPTNKLAAAVFDTTVARVSKARRLLEQRGRRHNGGGHHNCKPVSTLTDREVDRLVEQVGAELVEKLGAEACLRFLDRATQPELPLRAAERHRTSTAPVAM